MWVHRIAAALPPRLPGIAQNPLRHSAILRAPSKTLWRPRKTRKTLRQHCLICFFIFLFIVPLLTRSRFPFSTQDSHDWLGLHEFICTQDGWAQNGRKRGETMRYKRCSSPTDHPIQGTWLSSAQGMNRWQEASGDRVLHELVPRIPRVASNIRVGSVKPSESWTYHDMSTCPMMSAIRRLNVFKKWKLNLHHKTHKTFS